MANPAIRVEHLSKLYTIGAAQPRHDTLRDWIAYGMNGFFRRNGKLDDIASCFWALQDVSFEIEPGEVVGVIGRNGAGKSTLLKILSRITEPTAGFAEVHGRVGSLLEVGTGFHHELTGRENIYLNGAILGMKKAEIERKFDEIVAFAELEKFIDTPVKHYSSGMYMRLAFAVAAHLEPEILLVDEVLAVGDAAFQRKCLGKMSDVAREGRTVLFVSHNMGSIANLCARVLWLENGAIRFTGNAATVISEYLSSGAVTSSMWTNPSSSPDGDLHIESVRILSEDNQPSATVPFDKHFRIEITYVLTDSLRELAVVYQIKDVSGSVVWGSWDTDNIGMKYLVRKPGRYKSICTIPGGLLKPGRYLLSVASHANHKRLACHDDVLTFNVSEVGYRFNRNRAGVITPILEWEVSRTDERRIVAK